MTHANKRTMRGPLSLSPFSVVNFDIIPGWCSSLLMYKLSVQGWCKIHGSNLTENILKDGNDSSFNKNT